jgi:hypothetical protein
MEHSRPLLHKALILCYRCTRAGNVCGTGFNVKIISKTNSFWVVNLSFCSSYVSSELEEACQWMLKALRSILFQRFGTSDSRPVWKKQVVVSSAKF